MFRQPYLVALLLNTLPLVLAGSVERPSPAMLTAIERGPVISPDGKWLLRVCGEKDEIPWLMLESRNEETKYRVQVWPVNNAVYILWAPDSHAFAFTDVRFSDSHFLYVDHIKGYLSSDVSDLSSTIESHFSRFVGERYEVIRWNVKPLVWVGDGLLVTGIHSVTSEKKIPVPKQQPVQHWFRAYLVDVDQRKVLADLDEEQAKRKYGIDLRKEKW